MPRTDGSGRRRDVREAQAQQAVQAGGRHDALPPPHQVRNQLRAAPQTGGQAVSALLFAGGLHTQDTRMPAPHLDRLCGHLAVAVAASQQGGQASLRRIPAT